MDLQAVTTTPRIWLRRGRLDRLIAAGARPAENPDLARRAAQLSSMRFRRGLAVGLRRVIEAAEEPPSAMSSSVPLRRSEILAARALIDDVARHLEDGVPVTPRGVALVERLLTDGGSPLYARRPAGGLEADLRHARTTLLLGS